MPSVSTNAAVDFKEDDSSLEGELPEGAGEVEVGDLEDQTLPLFDGNEVSDTQLNAMQLYLRGIGVSELLSAEEEVRFGRLVRQGDRVARNRMIESNLRLVVSIARHYQGRRLQLGDLIAEGNLGLIRAVDKFDPERGFRFSTYASWWIREAIERALMLQASTVRLPVHLAKKVHLYLRTARQLAQETGREPGAEAIAERLGEPVAQVAELLTLGERVNAPDIPLTSPTDKSVIDSVPDENEPDPSEVLQDADLATHLDGWLAQLTDKQRTVLQRRFGLQDQGLVTLEDLGEELGLTRERVRQIQVQALDRLREILAEEGLTREVTLGL